MGNTTIRHKVVHSVIVKEVNLEEKFVIASWNSNRDRKYTEREIKGWKVKKPIIEKNIYSM